MKFKEILRKPFPYRQYNMAYILAGITVVIFVMRNFFNMSVLDYLVLVPERINQGMVWQFITYVFTHFDLTHLLFNMLFLAMAGNMVERHIGSWEFLFMYLLTGFFTGLTSYIFYTVFGSPHVTYYLLGASGAIFAVAFLFATFYPEAKILVWFILPVNAKVLVLAYAGISLVFILINISNGVSHIAHFSGFVFGILYFMVRYGKNPLKIWFPNRFQR